jgi:UDP-N-acetylglucosamine 2-epimerase (non-hydrolysing)
MQEITYNRETFYDDVAGVPDRHVHLILVATKPDIIKQVPPYLELKRRGLLAVLGHTGQHFSENLSGGMLAEFGVTPDFNLNVRGEMHEIVSQIIGRLGHVIGELKKRGKTVIPYVHGDTTTAMAASNAGYCHSFAAVHVEAGLRTLTPQYSSTPVLGYSITGLPEYRITRSFRFNDWRSFLMDEKNWKRGSLEPYPEQFNTRCSEAGTGVHLAPVELNKEFMLNEGFPEDRIFVVGNTVADATREALKKCENAKMRKCEIFQRYPQLADGDFVRFCIHRRENCVSPLRFKVIWGALKILVEQGKKVLLINMIQTKKAFERFGLEGELSALAKKHDNFLLCEVWPQYSDVIAAMSRAAVCATDSGSMQEEMNIMGVPCVTLRFGSDRSESALCGSNVIAPPVNSDLIVSMIEGAWNNEDMKNAPKIYGEDVCEKSVDAVLKVLEKGEVFRSEEGRLGV